MKKKSDPRHLARQKITQELDLKIDRDKNQHLEAEKKL